jgi:hypothetical protein
MRRRFIFLVMAAGLTIAAARGEDTSPSTQTEPTLPPSAPAPAAAPAAPKEAAPPPSVTVIGPAEAHGVLGRDVRSATAEDMGHMVDVLVDPNGNVRAAVIDFGGFLGVGSRKIVVDWSALHFEQLENKGNVMLELTKEQVKAAPEYKEDKPIVVLGASGNLHPFGP